MQVVSQVAKRLVELRNMLAGTSQQSFIGLQPPVSNVSSAKRSRASPEDTSKPHFKVGQFGGRGIFCPASSPVVLKRSTLVELMRGTPSGVEATDSDVLAKARTAYALHRICMLPLL